MKILSRGDDFEEILECPLCNGVSLQPFREAEYHLNLLPPISIKRCRRCSFVFMSPRPGPKLRAELFAGRLPQALEPYQVPIKYGNTTNSRRDLFVTRIDEIGKILSMKGLHFPDRLLDIGTASGYFVQLARQRGWEAYGVEASAFEAQGISEQSLRTRIIVGLAEVLPFIPASFSCIHAHHVWEHLLDPVESIKQTHRVLKPGGILYLEVPNQFDNIMFRRDMLFRRVPQRNRSMYSIHHYSYFSKKTLKFLFESSGFSGVVVGHKYEWPIMGWRAPLSLLTRLVGRLLYGGSIIYGFGIRDQK